MIQPGRPLLTWLAWTNADRAREAAYHLPRASRLVHDETWQAHAMPGNAFLATCLIRTTSNIFPIHAFYCDYLVISAVVVKSEKVKTMVMLRSSVPQPRVKLDMRPLPGQFWAILLMGANPNRARSSDVLGFRD
jgi:hypothetical protein